MESENKQKPSPMSAREFILRLIVKERKAKKTRFLHSFYSLGSDEQILEDDGMGSYGYAVLNEFNNDLTLAEVAEWMEQHATYRAGVAQQPPSCHVCGKQMSEAFHCEECGASTWPTTPEPSVTVEPNK